MDNQNEPTMNTENQSSSNVSTYLNGNSNQKSTPYAAKKQTQKTDQVQIPYLKSFQKGSADTESLLSKASQSDYKMSKSEQKQVREYAKKWLNDYSKGIRDGSISTQQAMKDTTDANSEYGKMVQLYNKSSSGTAFASGLIESALKLPGMSALGKKIDDMGNGTYRQYDNITKTVEDAKTQHPFAEGAGNMVGEMAKYQAANAVMSGIPVVQKAKDAVSGAVASIPFLSAGGNAVAAEVAGNQIPKLIGDSTANILSDLALDTVFDTIPYLHDTKQDGETAGQTAGKALKRTGYNLGLNIAGEAIPYLVSGAGKTVKNMLDSSADDIADAGREVVDMSSSSKNIENGAETATDALKQTDLTAEIEPLKAGKATTIKAPYSGEIPSQVNKEFQRITISDESMARANTNMLEANLSSEKTGKSYRNYLKKMYNDLFGNGDTTLKVSVDGTDFDGAEYIVDINKSAIGKIVSDKNLTVEKLAAIDSLDDIVKNAKYVGSGDYVNYKNLSKTKNVIRYDYFETEALINGEPYVVSFDVEVIPGSNKYRTHKVINEINLMRASDAAETASKVHSPSVEVGPVPTAAEAASGLTNNSIPISNERVNVSGTNNADYEGLPFTTPEADNARIPELGKPTSTGSSKAVNPDGTYVSRTATNTLRNSELVKSVEGAMDDLEKGIKNGDFNIEQMTEKESIQRAADALDKDYAGELKRLSTETWTNGSRDVDEGMIILENKLKDAAASGNFDEARAWMRKVVEQGSEKEKDYRHMQNIPEQLKEAL